MGRLSQCPVIQKRVRNYPRVETVLDLAQYLLCSPEDRGGRVSPKGKFLSPSRSYWQHIPTYRQPTVLELTRVPVPESNHEAGHPASSISGTCPFAASSVLTSSPKYRLVNVPAAPWTNFKELSRPGPICLVTRKKSLLSIKTLCLLGANTTWGERGSK